MNALVRLKGFYTWVKNNVVADAVIAILIFALLLTMCTHAPAATTIPGMVATCPGAQDGTQWTAWITPCDAVVYAPPNSGQIVGVQRQAINYWILGSKVLPTDQVLTDTVGPGGGASKWWPATAVVFAGAVPGNGVATISWIAPTQNTDGSILTNLRLYRVYQFNTDGTTLKLAELPVGTLTYKVSGLLPGTYSFTVTAVNTPGIESDYGNRAPIDISQTVTPKKPNAPGTITVKVTITVP